MVHGTVFWYPVIDPYMADRFNSLAASQLVQFECWFSDIREAERSWDIKIQELNFPHRFLPSLPYRGSRLGLPFVAWRDMWPDLLISFHGVPNVALSCLQLLRPGGKLVYYVEKTFDTWVSRTRAKEWAKRALLGSADAFLAPGSDADTYIRKYSTAPIHRLNHVIRYDHFMTARSMRGSEENTAERRALGLHGFVFLNVGRMWHQKGIGTLIDAFTELERAGVDASLLLVGDGVDRTTYQQDVHARGLQRVKFLDFVQQEDLPKIYALGDAFVFPTRGDPYGLVVDEALASALPVIASRSAGEIGQRVIPGRTGALVPRDDVAAFLGEMQHLVRCPDEARRMGNAGSEMASKYTLDHWVEQVQAAIETIRASTAARS